MDANLTNVSCVQFAASFIAYQATLWTFIVISTILLICGIFVISFLLTKDLNFDFGLWHGTHSLRPPRTIAPTEGIRKDSIVGRLFGTSVFTLVESNLIISNECELLKPTETDEQQENMNNASYTLCPTKEPPFEYDYGFDESRVIANREVISLEEKSTD